MPADASSRACRALTYPGVYAYRVAAVNAYGQSEWAQIIVDVTDVLETPTDLRLSDYDPYNDAATMTWTPVEGATGYLVQSSVDGGKTWRTLPSLEADATSRACTFLSPGVSYIYRIAAVSETGRSEWAEVALDLTDVPAQPTGLSMSNYDPLKGVATMTWIDVEGETGYLVQSSVDGGKTWRTLPALEADATSRVCRSLYPGNAYIYRVAAVNETGRSEWAEIVFNAPVSESVSAALLTSEAFADAFDEFDFFVDEDELEALAKRLV